MAPADKVDGSVDPSNETGGTGRRILYPVFESYDTLTFEIALDVADGADAELTVLDLVADGEPTDGSESTGARLLANHRDENRDVETELLVEEGATPVKTVATVARSLDVDLVVFDGNTPESLTGLLRGDVPDRVASDVSCDTVTVARRAEETRIGSILVPIAGGPHSNAAVLVSGAIALALDVPVELFHVSEPNSAEDPQRVRDLFETHREPLPSGVDVETWHLEGADVADAIVEQSRYYGLTVLGKPRSSRLRRFVAGSVTDDVSENAENTVLVTQHGSEEGFRL